ncbi:unannotated protein [freshwater metagenome]|uniref:Unannotated protein n=1 Tax=freshwater metagenome TaxID=449393 RepID=A0A6J6W4G4_9ZZZZ
MSVTVCVTCPSINWSKARFTLSVVNGLSSTLNTNLASMSLLVPASLVSVAWAFSHCYGPSVMTKPTSQDSWIALLSTSKRTTASRPFLLISGIKSATFRRLKTRLWLKFTSAPDLASHLRLNRLAPTLRTHSLIQSVMTSHALVATRLTASSETNWPSSMNSLVRARVSTVHTSRLRLMTRVSVR